MIKFTEDELKVLAYVRKRLGDQWGNYIVKSNIVRADLVRDGLLNVDYSVATLSKARILSVVRYIKGNKASPDDVIGVPVRKATRDRIDLALSGNLVYIELKSEMDLALKNSLLALKHVTEAQRLADSGSELDQAMSDSVRGITVLCATIRSARAILDL